MAYKKKVYRFPNAIEVEQYHTGRYGAPGQQRTRRKKPTSEQIEKKNQRNKEDRCRRKLRAHFRSNHDYYVTLTYAPEARPPDMETAKEDFRKMIRKLRREYASCGCTPKWIRNIEVGSRGAWHIHMVINRIPGLDVVLQQLWTHGRVHLQITYDSGEFRDLAKYLTKTPRTDPRLKDSHYCTSRNLPIPEPEEKIMLGKHWKDIAKIPEGFFLDKESYWEGINPVTGYLCRRYTLLRYHRRC